MIIHRYLTVSVEPWQPNSNDPRQAIQYDKVDNSDRITEPSTLFNALMHKPSEQLYPAYAPRDNRHTCPTS